MTNRVSPIQALISPLAPSRPERRLEALDALRDGTPMHVRHRADRNGKLLAAAFFVEPFDCELKSYEALQAEGNRQQG